MLITMAFVMAEPGRQHTRDQPRGACVLGGLNGGLVPCTVWSASPKARHADIMRRANMYEPRSAADRADGLSRRAFLVHVGAAAGLLKTGRPALGQIASPAVPGKERLIVRSPRP